MTCLSGCTPACLSVAAVSASAPDCLAARVWGGRRRAVMVTDPQPSLQTHGCSCQVAQGRRYIVLAQAAMRRESDVALPHSPAGPASLPCCCASDSAAGASRSLEQPHSGTTRQGGVKLSRVYRFVVLWDSFSRCKQLPPPRSLRNKDGYRIVCRLTRAADKREKAPRATA